MTELTKEEKIANAYTELKLHIVGAMFIFTDKYAGKGENCLYPECGQVLIDVLHDCLQEAKI